MTLQLKKRKYEKPHCEVYELSVQPKILAGSGEGGFGGNPGYEPLP